jgi:hypothetical protein
MTNSAEVPVPSEALPSIRDRVAGLDYYRLRPKSAYAVIAEVTEGLPVLARREHEHTMVKERSLLVQDRDGFWPVFTPAGAPFWLLQPGFDVKELTGPLGLEYGPYPTILDALLACLPAGGDSRNYNDAWFSGLLAIDYLSSDHPQAKGVMTMISLVDPALAASLTRHQTYKRNVGCYPRMYEVYADALAVHQVEMDADDAITQASSAWFETFLITDQSEWAALADRVVTDLFTG